jgi:hypothetical protein
VKAECVPGRFRSARRLPSQSNPLGRRYLHAGFGPGSSAEPELEMAGERKGGGATCEALVREVELELGDPLNQLVGIRATSVAAGCC